MTSSLRGRTVKAILHSQILTSGRRNRTIIITLLDDIAPYFCQIWLILQQIIVHHAETPRMHHNLIHEVPRHSMTCMYIRCDIVWRRRMMMDEQERRSAKNPPPKKFMNSLLNQITKTNAKWTRHLGRT